MKILTKAPDGGANSGVTAYFLCEIKPLFSIALLKFNPGSREAYHSHAFNALTLWLKGHVKERLLVPRDILTTDYKAGQLKYTPRENMHKIESQGTAWALTIRGPWSRTWKELRNTQTVTLTHGREVVHAG